MRLDRRWARGFWRASSPARGGMGPGAWGQTESGRAPYPIERTFLVSGVLESCLSKLQAHRRLDTPYLAVRYQPPATRAFAEAERACGHRPGIDGSSANDRV